MTDAEKVIKLFHSIKECKDIFDNKELSSMYIIISDKLEELNKKESRG